MASSNPIEGANPSSLDDLDDFSLLSVFDWLSLHNLARLASLSPRYKELIVHHYFNGKYRLHKRIPQLSVHYGVSIDFEEDHVGLLMVTMKQCGHYGHCVTFSRA